MEELLNNLEQDLANVNATKQTHIQIMNIMNAYKQKAKELESSDKDKTKKQ